MNENVKLGASVIGGYLLGRTKKGKLALRLGYWAATRNSGMRPRELFNQVANNVTSSPEMSDAISGLRREFGDAGKRLAGEALSRQLNSLADQLHQRTVARSGEQSSGEGGSRDEPAPSSDSADNDEARHEGGGEASSQQSADGEQKGDDEHQKQADVPQSAEVQGKGQDTGDGGEGSSSGDDQGN